MGVYISGNGLICDFMESYEQNMDLFSVLLKDDKMNKNLMGVFLEDVYSNLRPVV